MSHLIETQTFYKPTHREGYDSNRTSVRSSIRPPTVLLLRVWAVSCTLVTYSFFQPTRVCVSVLREVSEKRSLLRESLYIVSE